MKIPRPAQLSVAPIKKNPALAERRAHDRASLELEKYRTLIAERQKFVFVRTQGPRATAKDQAALQVQCPARAGRSSVLWCPAPITYPRTQPARFAAKPRIRRKRVVRRRWWYRARPLENSDEPSIGGMDAWIRSFS